MRIADQIAESSTDNLRRLVRWAMSKRATLRASLPDTMTRDALEEEALWEFEP